VTCGASIAGVPDHVHLTARAGVETPSDPTSTTAAAKTVWGRARFTTAFMIVNQPVAEDTFLYLHERWAGG
jgi:hypothetical protein